MTGWLYSGSRSHQLFGDLVHRVESNQPLVALTFDDGPFPAGTAKILNILEEQQVRATFFLVGDAIRRNQAAAQQIAAAGHELGNHSWSHQRMVFLSPAEVRRELEDTDAQIRQLGFTGPIHFRPPYGKKLAVLPWVLREREQLTITWDVEPETYDEVRGSAEAITEHVLTETRPGSIILLHVMVPARENSLAAVPDIIEGLRSRGFRFVTVSELLAHDAGKN